MGLQVLLGDQFSLSELAYLRMALMVVALDPYFRPSASLHGAPVTPSSMSLSHRSFCCRCLTSRALSTAPNVPKKLYALLFLSHSKPSAEPVSGVQSAHSVFAHGAVVKTLENNFMQWPVVNTLFQEKMDHHNQEDGSKGTPKLGPYSKSRPVACMVNMDGVEIKIWSMSGDNTHSWVRTSHGSNKFVMDSNNNDTEVQEDQPEEQALQLNVKDFACRSKAKAKPQRREPAGYSPRIIPMNTRNWIYIEPGKHSLFAYEVSKKVIHLLRHSQQVHREDDGAVHFWRIKENLQSQFPQTPHWSDDKWKKSMAGGGGNKKRYQCCTDSSGKIVYLRALQGHSGRNLIDPSLQDNVVIPSNFLPVHLLHWMCIQSSLYYQQWINTWRSEFKQETDSILSA